MDGGSGEWTVRRGDYRNYYKGHMDKMKHEGGSRARGGFDWGLGEWWGKMQTTVIKQQYNIFL